MSDLTHLSLFSGIGGIDLAAERAGFRTVAQVECNPFCLRVLTKHWPSVPRFEDVRDVSVNSLRDAGIERPTLVSGGFPCQDISFAGLGGGLQGDRSGLFYELFRIVSEIRPKYALMENVAALTVRGLSDILGEFARIRYNVEWWTLQASWVGAPHRRKRIFLVAYPCGVGVQGLAPGPVCRIPSFSWCENVRGPADFRGRSDIPEPLVWRDSDGFSAGVDRLRALGNAVVPQQIYPILQAIADIERGRV